MGRPGDGAEKRTGWTLMDVEARIEEAVATLQRLPAGDIQRNVTRWPDYVRASHEAYGYGEFRPRPAPASPRAITRLDETLGWLRWLPRDAQAILWSRASGLSWRRIAVFAGRAPNTCRTWYLGSLHHIASRLNADGPAKGDGQPPAGRSATVRTRERHPGAKPTGTAAR